MSADEDLRRALALPPRPPTRPEDDEEEARRRYDARVRRTRRRVALGIGGLIVLVAGAVGVLTVDRGQQATGDLRSVGPAIGDDRGRAVGQAAAAAFSPDGARLAVLDGEGRLGLVEAGRTRALTPEGTVVAAAAWLGSTSLLVQEGPGATGELAVVGVDGAVRRTIPLSRRVLPAGSLAVVGDVALVLAQDARAEGLGDEGAATLVRVALRTGEVADAVPPGEVVGGPVVALDARRAAARGRAGVVVVDAATPGAPVVPLTAPGRLVGALPPRDAVLVDGADLLAVPVDGGAARRIGRGAGVMAVAPDGRVARATADGLAVEG